MTEQATTGGQTPTDTPSGEGGTMVTGAAPAEPNAANTGQDPNAAQSGTPEGSSSEPGTPEGQDTDGQDSEATGAPEAYAEFTMPEGVSIQPEVLEAFTATAKELNLPQDGAQKMVDVAVQWQQEQMQAEETAWEEQNEQWQKEVKSDPEVGGAKLESTLANAARARVRFGTEGLNKILDDSGLGNHIEMVRFFAKIGAAISEDGALTPASGEGEDNRSRAERMYPDQAKAS